MVERIKELESAQNNWEMEREAMSQRINSLEEMVKEVGFTTFPAFFS